MRIKKFAQFVDGFHGVLFREMAVRQGESQRFVSRENERLREVMIHAILLSDLSSPEFQGSSIFPGKTIKSFMRMMADRVACYEAAALIAT